MNTEIDPELVLLKWAYKRGQIDDDALHDFHVRRRRERPDASILESALAWALLTAGQVDALLEPAAIAEGVASGQIDAANARALASIVTERNRE